MSETSDQIEETLSPLPINSHRGPHRSSGARPVNTVLVVTLLHQLSIDVTVLVVTVRLAQFNRPFDSHSSKLVLPFPRARSARSSNCAFGRDQLAAPTVLPSKISSQLQLCFRARSARSSNCAFEQDQLAAPTVLPSKISSQLQLCFRARSARSSNCVFEQDQLAAPTVLPSKISSQLQLCFRARSARSSNCASEQDQLATLTVLSGAISPQR
jgi:hypothetical protein